MSRLNRIFDVFSRRSKASFLPTHNIPNTFRDRIFLWCRDIFSANWNGGMFKPTFLGEIHRFLQYRHGKAQLVDNPVRLSPEEDAIAYLSKCSGEEFFDFLEYIFRVDCLKDVHRPKSQLVEEINELLRIDRLPYYVTDFVTHTVTEVEKHPFAGDLEHNFPETPSYPKLIMRENEILHDQAIKPVLQLLQRPEYSSANSELLEALEDYRKGELRDCLTKCGSAFESVCKILCDRKGWNYNPTDTANTLIKIILDNTDLDSYFQTVLIIIATLRNKLSSSHGAGPTKRDVHRYHARYSINATASAILLIVEAAGDQ